MTAEKRKHHPRLEAHMKARIIGPGNLAAPTCVIRQVSFAGAQVELDPGWILPRCFWLKVVGEIQLHFCILVWRDGSRMGLEFRRDHRPSWWSHSRKLTASLA
jgi:hypothetical protein